MFLYVYAFLGMLSRWVRMKYLMGRRCPMLNRSCNLRRLKGQFLLDKNGRAVDWVKSQRIRSQGYS